MPSVPWPWALGSVAAVILVLVSTLVAHALVRQTREEALVIPTPPAPLLAVNALVRPEGGARLVAVDASAGVADVLAAQEVGVATTPQGCPPHLTGCVDVPPAATFIVLDDTTGAVMARVPLNGACAGARDATVLLVDGTRGRAYAINGTATGTTLIAFASRGGTCLGATSTTPPSSGDLGSLVGAALTQDGSGLYLAYSHALLLVDPSTGTLLRAETLAPGDAPLIAGPALDQSANAVFVLARGPGTGVTLSAFASGTLAALARVALPAGTRLGPSAPDGRALVLIAPDGTLTLRATAPLLDPSAITGAPDDLAHLDGQRGVAALGWTGQGTITARAVLLAGMNQTRLLDVTASGTRTVAALPLALASWPTWQPLPADTARDSIILPSADGSLIFAQAGATSPVNRNQALLLAHAALSTYLPDTNQQPAFITPAAFPILPGEAARAYYIHFSNLGWQGPYAGTARTSVTTAAGATTATYTITWDQLFTRTHTWVVRVDAAGAVRLIASSGDGIP